MKIERRLTPEDRAALESYRFKCREIKGFTKACIIGQQTGMMLFGSGGNGKSYSVRKTLEEEGVQEITPKMILDAASAGVPLECGFNTWICHQGRITPKGLVTELFQYPKSIHLVEDAETMFDDRNCWGVLRNCLHSQKVEPHSERNVTWKTSVAKGSFNFNFYGSVIIVGNRLLNEQMQEVQAVQTRAPCMNFDVTNTELIAQMKATCNDGYSDGCNHLQCDDCYTVLEYMLRVIDDDPELKTDAKGVEKKLNLRLLNSGFKHMICSRLIDDFDWREYLLSQMKKLVGASKKTRAERIHDEKKIAEDFAKRKWTGKERQHQKLVEWCKLTGRDLAWSDQPRDSEEYARGFNSAKTDLSRKSK